MDELAAATPLESMATSDSGELATANGEPGVNLSDASVQKIADSVFSAWTKRIKEISAVDPRHGVELLEPRLGRTINWHTFANGC